MKRYRIFIILAIGLVFRLWRINQPANYVFDEVYHVPSLRAFAQNNPAAFDVYAQAPEPNTAYDWLHPPLAKLFQAGSVLIFGDNSFAWRFPAAVFGTVATAGVYFLTLAVTQKNQLAVLAALIFSFDNLQLTMSRIAMNDIFVTAWILWAMAWFYGKHWWRAGLATGLALATKHSAILLLPLFFIWSFKGGFTWKKLLPIAILTPLIYLLSYGQFWWQGHSWQQFVDLHRQIYWYQTHLDATHDYQSTAWQWILLIRPVWFHVQYFTDKIANIYNLGNPLIFWLGVVALTTIKTNAYLLLAFLSLWLPFIFSPRIMFLHHYLPALGVLTVIEGIWLGSLSVKVRMAILVSISLTFIWFYPLNTALPIPKDWLSYWFWLKSWR